MNILITGGAGNLGYELQRSLDFNITLMDIKNLRYSTTHNFIKNDLIENNLAEYIVTAKFDIIIHLVAISRVVDAEKNAGLTHKSNVVTTQNLINSVKTLDKKPHIIFTSSREVYGESFKVFDETSRCNPLNIYGSSKRNSEILLQDSAQKYDIPITILRIANIYGGGRDLKERFIPKLLDSVKFNTEFTLIGNQKKLNFVHIADVVSIIAFLIKDSSENQQIKIYNIASDATTSLKDLLEIVKSQHPQFRYKIEVGNKYEVTQSFVSNQKIIDLTNHTFKKIETEITQLIEESR